MRALPLLMVTVILATSGCIRTASATRATTEHREVEREQTDVESDPITPDVLAVVARPLVLPAADWRAPYAEQRALSTLAGRVSYYHDSLEGNSTASGEPYDPDRFTAASRSLPFGTVLRVVRLDTGASTIVRVNDRGPFGRRRRLLDLSRAAAEELGMIDAGVIRARAEILERGVLRTALRSRRR